MRWDGIGWQWFARSENKMRFKLCNGKGMESVSAERIFVLFTVSCIYF